MTTAKTTTAAPRKTATKKTAVPPGAKVPQDRKPPASATPDVRVVSLRGEDWKIPLEVLDDFELLDDLNALDQRDDATRMPSVLRRFLGDEQWTKAMALLRDPKTGRVTVETGSAFVWELVEALNPNS